MESPLVLLLAHLSPALGPPQLLAEVLSSPHLLSPQQVLSSWGCSITAFCLSFPPLSSAFLCPPWSPLGLLWASTTSQRSWCWLVLAQAFLSLSLFHLGDDMGGFDL